MSAWEPAVFNLANSYRKLKMYSKAVECYETALAYCPRQASSYAALGFTFHLQGNIYIYIYNYIYLLKIY